MFWKKKSKPQPNNYMSFYLAEDGDLKIEFGFDEIEDFTTIADLVLNGKVRNSCFEMIKSKLEEGGLVDELKYFKNSVNKSIKPSEYNP